MRNWIGTREFVVCGLVELPEWFGSLGGLVVAEVVVLLSLPPGSMPSISTHPSYSGSSYLQLRALGGGMRSFGDSPDDEGLRL